MYRRSDTQIQKEREYSDRLDNLFDIAHQDAKRLTKIPQDWEFLVAQRKGRKGYMAGEDKKFSRKTMLKLKKKESERNRREKSKKEIAALMSRVELESSSNCSGNEDEDIECISPPKHLKKDLRTSRKNINSTFVTEEVAAALDRTKISDREAPHVLAATAHSLGYDIQDLTLSRSSIRRARMQYRVQCARDIQLKFAPEIPLVVHWDGKLLIDITGKEKVDRLPVIVSGAGTEQLLGVPKITSSTGALQAAAVVNCLDEWHIRSKIKGMCFDTTASNTGKHAGACILIKRALKKDLLYLACRHHIMEIVAEKAFMIMNISSSTGPDISIFKIFQAKWPEIDKNVFETAVHKIEINSFKDRIIDFAKANLKVRHPRDDYKELLELVIIFLGGKLAREIHFQSPGALHRARWMAKIIYSFKMWMFRSQFKLKPKVERGLFHFLLFISEVYIQAWFEAPSSVSAPANDLRFLFQLVEYKNPEIRKVASSAFKRHLWYLNEVLVGLAFFDPKVSILEKKKMVMNMQKQKGSEDPLPRLDTKQLDTKLVLSSFVTTKTKDFFEILELKNSFLLIPPESWKDNEEYQASERTVLALKVVNDIAERGVKLITDYNTIITHNEEQKQYLLQVVQEHRRKFPDSKKRTLSSGLKMKAK